LQPADLQHHQADHLGDHPPSLNGVPSQRRRSRQRRRLALSGRVRRHDQHRGRPARHPEHHQSGLGNGTTVVTGSVSAAMVKFAASPGPDGNYTVEALCTNKAGAVGHSTKGTYPVDSTPRR